jgi:hypothetical protein
MKLQASQAVRPLAHNPDTNWQILGELELPLGANAHSMLGAWLSDVLASLHLHADFLSKILESAEEVVARAMQTETVIQHQRTRLLIMTPANLPLNVQTWGFFRIEKVELTAENDDSPDHKVEFYLFPER